MLPEPLSCPKIQLGFQGGIFWDSHLKNVDPKEKERKQFTMKKKIRLIFDASKHILWEMIMLILCYICHRPLFYVNEEWQSLFFNFQNKFTTIKISF